MNLIYKIHQVLMVDSHYFPKFAVKFDRHFRWCLLQHYTN